MGIARTAVCALALCCAILGGAAGPAMAEPGIEFRLPGSQTKMISATEIANEADVTARDYTVRSGSGEQVVSRSGLSVRKALQLAGADPDRIGVLEIVRPSGRTVSLTAADLADPPPFPDGPALVSVDGQSTRFLRPVRNGSDVNADDDFAIDNGQPLVVHVDKDNAVAVTSAADRTTVKAGETVTFTASVTGGHPGEVFEARWDFGDGRSGVGGTITHAFTKGTYNVVVTAHGDEGSTGAAAPIRITVRAAAGGGGGKGGGGKGGGGKGNENNGNDKNDKKGKKDKKDKKGRKGNGGGRPGHNNSSSPGTATPGTTTSGTTATSTTPSGGVTSSPSVAPSVSSSTPPPVASPSPPPPAASTPPAQPPPSPPPPATPAPPPTASVGEEVSGTELSGPGGPVPADPDGGEGSDGSAAEPLGALAVVHQLALPLGLAGGMLGLLLGGAGLESWAIRRHRPTGKG